MLSAANNSFPCNPFSWQDDAQAKLNLLEGAIVRTGQIVHEQKKCDRTIREAYLDEEYRKKQRKLVACFQCAAQVHNDSLALIDGDGTAGKAETRAHLELLADRESEFGRSLKKEDSRRQAVRLARQRELDSLERDLMLERAASGVPRKEAEIRRPRSRMTMALGRKVFSWFHA